MGRGIAINAARLAEHGLAPAVWSGWSKMRFTYGEAIFAKKFGVDIELECKACGATFEGWDDAREHSYVHVKKART